MCAQMVKVLLACAEALCSCVRRTTSRSTAMALALWSQQWRRPSLAQGPSCTATATPRAGAFSCSSASRKNGASRHANACHPLRVEHLVALSGKVAPDSVHIIGHA